MKKNIIIQLFLFFTLSFLFSCKKSSEEPEGNIKIATRYSPTLNGSCSKTFLKNGYARVQLYKSNGALISTQNSPGNSTLDFGTQAKGDYYIVVKATENVANSCNGDTYFYKDIKKQKNFSLNTANAVIDIAIN